MVRSSRYFLTAQSHFFLLFFTLVFFSGSSLASVESEDINNLSENTRKTLESFYQESFDLRMQYEYSGRFITSEHGEKLHSIANDTCEKLIEISSRQKELKKKIEDYEGQDWEQRYGQTGIWRKLSWDIHVTELAVYQTNYYSALTLEETAQNELIKQLQAKIIKIDSDYSTADSKLLKAKVFSLISKMEPKYKEMALEGLEEFMLYSDVERTVSAAIVKLKLLETIEPEQLNALINILFQNFEERYLELVLSVAFLQRRHDPNGLEKTLELFPKIENLIGTFSLNELSSLYEQNLLTLDKLQHISLMEIEIAVASAWASEPENYKKFLKNFLKVDKFRTPLVIYVTAASLAQSSPPKSVELLIEASKLQKKSESKKLSLSASGIAEQSAWLGFSLLEKGGNNCHITGRAFENYFNMTRSRYNEELEYLYSVVLKECGQVQESRKLLQKIANRSDGEWKDKATMELVADSIRQKQHRNIEQKHILLNKVTAVINNDNKQQYCNYASEIKTLLDELTDRIEQIEVDVSDFSLLLSQLRTCAEFCYDCLEDFEKYRVGLLWGELLVFANSNQTQRFSELQYFIDSSNQEGHIEEVDLLRYRARLSMSEDEFAEAAQRWSQICRIRKSEGASDNERSWKWWRAKYYELYCCRHIPEYNKQDLSHTIDILETTYPEIPPLWLEKLISLKNSI
ncbi:MAG: hypothetical protein ACYTFE_01110 [Planctomycetota bacterium]